MDPARQIVAELAANAATHGRVPGRDFRLVLYASPDTLRIEVTDTRPERIPAPQHPSPEAESGRGLVLVEAFADRWGVAEGPAPRKTVWAELDFPGGALQESPTGAQWIAPHGRDFPATRPITTT